MLGLFAILMLRDMLVSNVTFVYLLQKNLVNLVHHMGGAIRKDFSTKVTHLIAYSTHGEKYKVCKTPLTFPPIWKSSCIDLIHVIYFLPHMTFHLLTEVFVLLILSGSVRFSPALRFLS